MKNSGRQISKVEYTCFDLETTGIGNDVNIVAAGAAQKLQSGKVKERYWTPKKHEKHPVKGERRPTAAEETRVIKELVNFLTAGNGNAVYSFNGTGYDMPVLWNQSRRADDYGRLSRTIKTCLIPSSVDLATIHRRELGNIGSLEEIAQKEYGIKHQHPVDGSQVPTLYQQKNMQQIIDYLQEDIRVTTETTEKTLERLKTQQTSNQAQEQHHASSHS